jgi:ubiquinone/menaquinone biosynthesis C-methylase UbiE
LGADIQAPQPEFASAHLVISKPVDALNIQADFDRLARLDSSGWTHNNHYHNFLLRQLPPAFENALEIGCGTGAFSRLLAARAQSVRALDLSPEMIRVAQERSLTFPNIAYEVADAMLVDFPAERFDCIATVATLHHLALREALLKFRAALKPGGVLLVLDLFQPNGAADALRNVCAMAVSGGLRLLHNGRLKPPAEVRAAWEAHGAHDSYSTVNEIQALCQDLLPGAAIQKHLLWRYSVVYKKGCHPSEQTRRAPIHRGGCN